MIARIFFKLSFVLIMGTFIIVSCQRKVSEQEQPPQENIYSDVFIAHAGGRVDGHIRTNSLEGLNASYKNGFRMFELDFQMTTDGKIVAVHDPIEITEAEFLAQPIEGKFTPMNMEMVRLWFEEYPDAILVTDKINRPKLIAEQFKFKDRVIMELFTWEAVDEAIELGITPMVSQNIFWDTPNIEDRLDSLNLKYVGMHREYIARDEELLKRLKEKGIKTYVWFTLPKIEGMKPEEYVWEYDLEFCYGMYANDLDILVSLRNRNTEKIGKISIRK